MPIHYQFNYMCANNRCCCQNIIIETIKKNKKCSFLLMLSDLSFAVWCVLCFFFRNRIGLETNCNLSNLSDRVRKTRVYPSFVGKARKVAIGGNLLTFFRISIE